MRRRSRQLTAVLVALLTATVVAGCVSLPDSSGVNPGHAIGRRGSGNHIRFAPPPPRVGASRVQIVQGYLQAMLAYPQSPALVRKFLTPDATQTWRPGQLLLVYQNPEVVEGLRSSVELTAEVLGSLDERGSWVSASTSDDELNTTLTLERVAGQWRISNPPAGTFLDTDTFDRYYHQYSLYFFDPAHTVLVPDPVYELVGSPNHLATALVRNLLLGPTASMGGVAATEVSPTTKVDPTVTVSTIGLADIPLTSQVLALSPAELNLFAAQLAWTLRQEGVGVTHVRITVGTRVIVIPGLGETFPVVDSFAVYDPSIFAAPPNLYALADGHLVAVTSSGPLNGAYPVQGPIGTLITKATSAAVDVSASHAALVVDDRTRVVVGSITAGDDQQVNADWLTGAEDLLKPSWDGRDLLWTVDRTSHGAVVRVLSSTGSRVVDAPGIQGQDVRSFAVSRDGMRFAAVIGRRSSSRLVIAMIRRNPAVHLDVSLTSIRPIGNAAYPLVNLTRLAWFSPTVVTVLAQVEGSEPQPYEIAIDGSRVQPTTGFLPVRPVTLAAGASADVPPVIGTSDGRLYIRTPTQQWPALTIRGNTRLLAPTYPG